MGFLQADLRCLVLCWSAVAMLASTASAQRFKWHKSWAEAVTAAQWQEASVSGLDSRLLAATFGCEEKSVGRLRKNVALIAAPPPRPHI